MTDWLNNLSATQQFALFTGVKVLAAFAILMTMNGTVQGFLLDENIASRVGAALSSLGYDIVTLRREEPGLEDDEIIDKSAREKRVIITQDHDYGYLIFNQNKKPYSVLLIRIHNASPDLQKMYILQAIEFVTAQKIDYQGNFLVFNGNRLRVRPI